MLRVALTGGIGTGKTYVRPEAPCDGRPTIDADTLVHQALGRGSDVGRQIAARFGADIVTTEGGIDRSKLAPSCSPTERRRRDLESIVHPVVWLAVQAWLDGLSAGGSHAVAVADIPLLYEAGRQAMFDRVIVVACSPDRQVRRVMERDELSEAEARRRLAAQWPHRREGTARRLRDSKRRDLCGNGSAGCRVLGCSSGAH